MHEALVPRTTLAGALWPAAGREAMLRNIVLVVLGSLLLTASAKVQAPFWPVPMTMQTFVVLVLGASYGWRLGTATVLIYLAQGAAGLPVFAGTPQLGAGLAYLAGPTGGFLVGFAVAAAITGALTSWQRHWLRTLAAMLLGTMALFACGLLWLSLLIGPVAAIQHGLLPFLPSEALKVALATALVSAAWRVVRR